MLSQLKRHLVLLIPLAWIFLPNLALIYLAAEPFDALDWALFAGVSLSCVAVPFLWSRTLRSCLLWNLPFAVFVSVYGGYIQEFRQAPYSGMWSTLWYATSAEVLEYAHVRWPVIVLGLAGTATYLGCALSRHNLRPIESGARKIYLAILCWWTFVLLGIPTLWDFPHIRILKPIKPEVFYSSYPVGVFVQGVRTVASLAAPASGIAVPAFNQVRFPGREIYVLVIGESEQYYRWDEEIRGMKSSLLTNPQAALFRDAISQAAFTHLSVPMLLTGTDDLGRAGSSPTWLQFARARGCRTGWLTANEFQHQGWYRSAVDFTFDLREDTKGIDRRPYDDMLLPELRRVLKQGANKLCLVAHMSGSHSIYSDRYRPEQERYKVDPGAMSTMFNPGHKASMHAAYRNSLIKNIEFLEAVILELEKYNTARVLMAYTSDHGENLFDDGTGFFAHGRPSPSRFELRVPLMVWASSRFIQEQPQEWRQLTEDRGEPVSSKYVFPTLLWAMGIDPRPLSDAPTLFAGKDALRSAIRTFSTDDGKPIRYDQPEPRR